MSEKRAFEKWVTQELFELLSEHHFQTANVFVQETEQGSVMIQVIYPWGYLVETIIATQGVTIFSLVEDFCIDKLACGLGGGFIATQTYLRIWIDKSVATQKYSDELPHSFSA